MIVGRMAVSSGVASGENDRTRRPRGRHPCRGAGSLRLCRVPKLVLIPGAPLISILFLTQALNAVLLLPPWCSSASHRGERFAAGRQLSAPDSSAPRCPPPWTRCAKSCEVSSGSPQRRGGKTLMPALAATPSLAAMEAIAITGSYLTPDFEHARVSDAMRPRVLTCDPQTSMVSVAQRMASEHVHAIVVLRETIDADGAIARRACGILTDRDVLRCAADIDDRVAEDIAVGGVLTVNPDDRLSEVAERMLDQNTSHAVVVEPRTGRPVGVVSTLDIAGILGWGRG
jgi:CBS domain-containing protein